jgi:nucleoside 2-deoxyribosyltransferase
MKVYLSGGFHSDWQHIVKVSCPDIKYIDPKINGLRTPASYTLWDMMGIKECDILFAYLEEDNPSGIGLAFEIGFAKGLGKTTVLVNKKDDKYTAILEYGADVNFTTLQEGIELLKALSERLVK